jgi:hypothetical protein
MICRLIFLCFLFVSYSCYAQIVGTEGYLVGNGVEVGISGNGGYEGSDINAGQPIIPIHFRSNSGNLFGFVADSINSNWTSFNGDFFTPGSPENGWGLRIEGLTDTIAFANNASGGVAGIPGAVGNYQVNSGLVSLEWNGAISSSGTDISINVEYLLHDNDLFYTTVVTITNDDSVTLNNLYYYRNVDPDNNVELSGDYETTNTIEANPPNDCDFARVSASQSVPWTSNITLIGQGENFRAGVGGFSNRNGATMWHGDTVTPLIVDQGYTNHADEAIYLAYRIDSLIGNESHQFSFIVALDSTAADGLVKPTINPVSLVCEDGGPITMLAYPTGGTWTSSCPTCIDSITGVFDPLIAGTGPSWVYYDNTLISPTCGGIDSSLVYVVDTIKPDIFTSPPVACSGDPAIFYGSAVSGGTWSSSCSTCINPLTGIFYPLGAPAGTHDIIYSIGGSCASSDTVQILISEIAFDSIHYTPSNCAVACNGEIEIFSTSAIGASIYDSVPYAPLVVYDSLCYGLYSVSIINADGCELTESVPISTVSDFYLDAVITHETGSAGNGSIVLSIIGTCDSCSYDWDIDGTGDFDDPQSIGGLSAGNYMVVVMDSYGCTEYLGITITNTTGLGGEDISSFNVYPNPVSNILTIDAENQMQGLNKVRLFDAAGRLVYSESVTGLMTYKIDMSSYSKGTYLLSIETEDGNFQLPVIK